MPDFDARYRRAFEQYLSDRSEAALGAAYELGREAVGSGRGVLELADAHHRALEGVLADGDAGPELAAAAADFFREALAMLELALGGFSAAHETARLQAEHAKRQRMLAAASLAINAELSPEAILQIAADQAQRILEAASAEAEMDVRREIGVARAGEPDARVVSAVAPGGAAANGDGRRVEAPIAGRGGATLGRLAVIDAARPDAE